MNANTAPFVFVGNNAAIDFINTEVINRGHATDLLKNVADLTHWAERAELPVRGKMTEEDFKEALNLRAALKFLYSAKMNGNPPSTKSLAILNAHLAKHLEQHVLRFMSNEYVLLPAHDGFSISRLLAYLAHEGAILLASHESSRMKKCSNPDCVLIFLDTSRNQKRRWCSMDVCGNRSKVSTHYRKGQS